MSRLNVDDIMALFAAHDVITTQLADGSLAISAGPGSDVRLLRWHCRCGASGDHVLDESAVAAERSVPLPLLNLGRRHVAEVIAAAVELSQREPAQTFSADELAADYDRRAAQIVNQVGGGWPRLEYEWRVERSIVSLLLRAGKLRVVRSGSYELQGIPVTCVDDRGDLDGETPTFELVVSP